MGLDLGIFGTLVGGRARQHQIAHQFAYKTKGRKSTVPFAEVGGQCLLSITFRLGGNRWFLRLFGVQGFGAWRLTL